MRSLFLLSLLAVVLLVSLGCEPESRLNDRGVSSSGSDGGIGAPPGSGIESPPDSVDDPTSPPAEGEEQVADDSTTPPDEKAVDGETTSPSEGEEEVAGGPGSEGAEGSQSGDPSDGSDGGGSADDPPVVAAGPDDIVQPIPEPSGALILIAAALLARRLHVRRS